MHLRTYFINSALWQTNRFIVKENIRSVLTDPINTLSFPNHRLDMLR